MTSSPMPTSSRRRCPICGKTPSEALKPFCSARCRDRDLLQWLGDGYALPGAPADPHTSNPMSHPDAIDELDADS